MSLADAGVPQTPPHGPPARLHSGHWCLPYEPLFRSGNLQTVAARYWPQSLNERLYHAEQIWYKTDPETTVLGRLNSQRGDLQAPNRPTVLAVHGLTACDHAPYMILMARIALGAGFDVLRLNVRNCGGTEHLCRTGYHSGLTSDLREVVTALAPRPVHIVGFSMGGNITLKLAGEWGGSPPPHVRAVCAISPPVQLEMCSRQIGQPRNFVYERRFLRQLRATLRRKRKAMPELFAGEDLPDPKSIWEFDDVVTAPAFGFRDASDYYAQCSAARFLTRIRIPSLVLQAQDDPLVPFDSFNLPDWEENPWLRLLSPRHGGHVAFLAKGGRRFWAQEQAVRFFAAMQMQEPG